MCIFCAETVKICTTASERKCAADIFYVKKKRVAASENISLFLTNVRLLLKKYFKKKYATASEKKCTAAS